MHANRNKSALRRIEKGMMRANRTRNTFAVLREFLSCFPLILRAFPAFCLSVIRCADHKKRPFSFSNSLMKRTIYYPK